MKKICLCFILFLFGKNSYAQGYDIISDDVDHIKKFTLHLNPWYGEYYGTNSTSGWGWKTEFFFKKALSFDFTFRKSKYMDQAKNSMMENPDFSSDDGFKNYTSVEPIFTFHVKKKVQNKNLHVRLSYKSSSNRYGNVVHTTTEEKYINVPGEVLTVSGIRFGVSNVSTSYVFNGSNMSNFDVSYFPLKGGNGYVEGQLIPGMIIDSMAINGGYTRYNSTGIVFGFSRKKITNVKVKVPGFGKKGNDFTTCIYGDFFLGLDNLDNARTTKNNSLNLSAREHSNGGWRLGFSYKKTNGYGISYSAEMGSRVGFTGPYLARFYMQATVGFSLVTPWKLNR